MEAKYEDIYGLAMLDDNSRVLEYKNKDVTNDDLIAISNYTKLTQLSLKDCKFINNNIEKKELTSSELNTNLGKCLNKLIKMEALQLYGVTNLTSITYVSNMSNLKELDIRKTGITDLSFLETQTVAGKLGLVTLAIDNAGIDLFNLPKTISGLNTKSYKGWLFEVNALYGGLVCQNLTSLQTLGRVDENGNGCQITYLATGIGGANGALDLRKCTKLKSFFTSSLGGDNVLLPSSITYYCSWRTLSPKFDSNTEKLKVFTNNTLRAGQLFNNLQACKSILSINMNCSGDFNPFYELTRLEGKGIEVFSTRYGFLICDATGFKIPSTLKSLKLFYTDSDVDTKDISYKIINMPSNILSPNGTSLTYLNIKQTDLTSTEWLEGLTNLEELKLVGNKINKLTFKGNFPKLAKLDLTNNEISEVKELEKIISLNILRMENNSISEIGYLDSSDETTKYYNLDVFANMFNNGLRYLYINSSTNSFTSVAKINNKAWLGKNGF